MSEHQRARPVGQRAQAQLLHVEQELDRVFLDVGDRRELVLHAVDPHGGDGRALQRAQEHAPQGVAQRDAEPGRQRRGDDPGVVALATLLPRSSLRSEAHPRAAASRTTPVPRYNCCSSISILSPTGARVVLDDRRRAELGADLLDLRKLLDSAGHAAWRRASARKGSSYSQPFSLTILEVLAVLARGVVQRHGVARA